MSAKRSFVRSWIVLIVAGVALCHHHNAKAATIQESITDTTYIDSRSTSSNFATKKIKLVANAYGTDNSSNDGSITRALFSLPASLASIPASSVASANIYFYNYGITAPTYNQPNPVEYTVPDVVLHPVTDDFSFSTATWASSSTGNTWSTPWTTPYTGGVGGPFDATLTATAVDVLSGGKPTANNWSYFDVTSMWSSSNFLNNGVVMMFANEIVPTDPNATPSTAHRWMTENWANQNWLAPPEGTPYIIVTTTPEPSTLALVIAGAVSLLAIYGKRRIQQRP